MASVMILLRRLTASPAFTVVSVLTLAIAIAANLVIFAVVNSVVLRPLPFPDGDRLIDISHVMPGFRGIDRVGISPGLYLTYLRESRSIARLSMQGGRRRSFTGPDNPERVQFATVTASLFDVLQVAPDLGRPFTVEDQRPGAAPVVILGASLWQARYGGDPSAIGRVVEIDGIPTEVVGVMPEDVVFPNPDVDAWEPMELNENDLRLGNFCCSALARLVDGTSLVNAEAELRTLATNLASLHPDEGNAQTLVDAGLAPVLVPAHESVARNIGGALWTLLGAAAVLILVACANIANLFLVRMEARQRELSIRSALGASRASLSRSVLGESLVLGLVGGFLALPLAATGVRLLVVYGPEGLPRLHEVSIDGSVFAFGFALSVVAGVLFGLGPVLRLGQATAAASLTEGGRGASIGRERHRVRRALVVAQVALALTLLSASGLAVRSFERMTDVDTGYDSEEVLTFSLALPERDYETEGSTLAFHRQLVERLQALPGVISAAATSSLPMRAVQGSGHRFEDQPLVEGDVPPILYLKWVSPEYFETMRISLLEGRLFEPLDDDRGGLVSIVSHDVAQTYWPNESALGKGIRGGLGQPDENWYRVIGIVENTHEYAVHQEQPEMVYYPLTGPGEVPRSMSYVVRAPDAASLGPAARDIVADLDPNLPLSDMLTMEAIVRESRSQTAFVMIVLIASATAALLLGAVGLFGVISYTVVHRRKEIAIRMAIGAQIAHIRRLVLGEALWLALAGAGLGLGLAAATTRFLEALLFETSPVDPMVLGSVSAMLVAVCILASWLPARQATKTQPMTALRLE